MSEIEIKDRLLRILTSENLSSSKFADILGVQRSSISHILSGRNKPSLDFLQKILSNFPLISAEWIILGKGEMSKSLRQTEIDFSNKAEEHSTNKESGATLTKQEITIEKPVEVKTPQKIRNIKKVVVFYDDNTFEELSPDK